MAVPRNIFPQFKGNVDEQTQETHLWKVPPLQQSRLKLEWNGEDADNDVRHGEIGNVEVGHSLHAFVLQDNQNDQKVAHDCHGRDRSVEK